MYINYKKKILLNNIKHLENLKNKIFLNNKSIKNH